MTLSIIVPVYNNEKYILDALTSVKDQARDDIELIVVNDGSIDRSDEIITAFATDNPYVKYIRQENKGVSAARNAALDAATGEYIGFLDSDDAYTEDALNDMLSIAKEYDADMVIGETKGIGTFADHVLPQCRKLSRKVFVDKYDTDLVYNFSCCNKLFRRDIIEKNHIRFQPIKHAEDGLFLFTYLGYCNTICGCPRIVYEYRKRIAIDGMSALKSLNKSMLESVLYATDKIRELIDNYPDTYIREFSKRVLRVTLINEYYRRLWILDDDAINLLWDKISYYQNLLGEAFWEEIISLSRDLELDQGLKTKEDIAKAPLVSILLPKGLNDIDYRDLLKSIYYLLCPNFEVIADSDYANITNDWYKNKLNFHFSETGDSKWADLVRQSRGKYVQIIDGPCIYDDNVIGNISRNILKSNKEFVAAVIRAYDDGKAYKNPEIERDFIIKKRKKSKSVNDHHDHMWMNKLIRRDALDRIIAAFGADSLLPEDSRFLYKELSFSVASKNVIGVKLHYMKDRNMELTSKETLIEVEDEALETPYTRFENILHFLYAILRVILPVRKKTVLFLSDIRSELGGNYVPLYDELIKNGYNVICDFVGNKHKRIRKKVLLRRMFYEATAGFIVLEEYHKDMRWLKIRQRQELVQLWHAAGAYKKFAWSRAGTADNVRIIGGYEKTTKAIVSSEAIRGNYAEAYNIGVDKVYATGLPRTDIFFDEQYKASVRAKYENKYPELKDKKIILISPTYRGVQTKKASYDYEQIDPARLHEELGDDYIIAFKWHPAQQAALKRKNIQAYDLTGLEGYVTDLSDERDINDLLMIADVVVTDYSSIIFEYELLMKPIVYYWYDVNYYKLARGMYYDLEEYVFGRVVYSFDQLSEAIKAHDLCEDKRSAFHDKFMSACDGHSTEKVVKEIFNS